MIISFDLDETLFVSPAENDKEWVDKVLRFVKIEPCCTG